MIPACIYMTLENSIIAVSSVPKSTGACEVAEFSPEKKFKSLSNIIWSINELCKACLIEQYLNISPHASLDACKLDYKMSDFIMWCISFTTLNKHT